MRSEAACFLFSPVLSNKKRMLKTSYLQHSSSWTRRDSNPRSLRCERSAFPAKLRAHRSKISDKNGGNGARTHDLSRVRRTLSRLSYVSMRYILPHFTHFAIANLPKMKVFFGHFVEAALYQAVSPSSDALPAFFFPFPFSGDAAWV